MDQRLEIVTGAKYALRQQVLASRAALQAAALQAAGQAITRSLLALAEVREAAVVAAYAALPGELPTAPLIDALHQSGVTVLLPVLAGDRTLSWRVHPLAGVLVPGALGTREPPAGAAGLPLSAANAVVLPGLCYDRRGNRLGRGGGSYDRALQDLLPATVTIGIALDGDVVEEVPVDSHDRPVQIVVTPTRVIVVDDGGK